MQILETLGGFMHGAKHQFEGSKFARVDVLAQTHRMIRAQRVFDVATRATGGHEHRFQHDRTTDLK